MHLSSFGEKLVGESGILRLMDDIGRPLPAGLDPCLLGGGNPARIPEVEALYRAEMERLLAAPGAFEEAIGKYDAPQGRVSFLEAIADFLRARYGWDVGPENVAVTNGSQSAFFYLFNLLSGVEPSRRTVLFPLVPEYVGYADQGSDHGTFVTLPARHESFGDRSFKYSIDLDLVDRYLAAHPEVGAICVSRPTNPTGNVLTDAEIAALATLARRSGIPLLVDNAYGVPFPNIIFPDRMGLPDGVEPVPLWEPGIVLSMSLSKIGLPALRTGIVVADREIVSALGALNSIVALASGSLGQVLAEGLVRSGELARVAARAVRPFYRARSEEALTAVREAFTGRDYLVHRSEGSIFLWLCLNDLSIPTMDLYARLKERGVVVVPGEYFFFGLAEGSEEETAWSRHPHRERCVRINYARPIEEVRRGLEIIAETSARFSG